MQRGAAVFRRLRKILKWKKPLAGGEGDGRPSLSSFGKSVLFRLSSVPAERIRQAPRGSEGLREASKNPKKYRKIPPEGMTSGAGFVKLVL
jgi:hypothetical protein